MRLLSKNKGLVLVLSLAALSGCADYMSRRDSITLGIGDATEGNIAIHTINPFPPEASNPQL